MLLEISKFQLTFIILNDKILFIECKKCKNWGKVPFPFSSNYCNARFLVMIDIKTLYRKIEECFASMLTLLKGNINNLSFVEKKACFSLMYVIKKIM